MVDELQLTKYILKRPYEFEKEVEKLDFVGKDYALVEVLDTAICTSDLRYFCGRRPKDILDKKLPVGLLHEGIGRVVISGNEELIKIGDNVVFVPLIPCRLDNEICKACPYIPGSENYCKNVKFISSDRDGLSCSHILYPIACLVKIPDENDLKSALFCEMISVAYEACIQLEKIGVKKDGKIAVIGTGTLAYFMILVLKYIFNVEKENLVVVGRDNTKVRNLDDISQQVITDDFSAEELNADITFECVGGSHSDKTIGCALKITKASGAVALLGLCDYDVPINTRLILEKNIKIVGIMRSPKEHYEVILKALENKEFSKRVKAIVNKEFTCSSPEDLYKAFKCFEEEKGQGKVICKFN